MERDYPQLSAQLKARARELGLLDATIAPFRLPESHAAALQDWLEHGLHGDMAFFERHGSNRTRADYVLANAQSVVMAALPYWTEDFARTRAVLADPDAAYISRYALGRDYHKVLRKRLQTLGEFLQSLAPDAQFRAVTDSAPLAEVSFASCSGLGWRGRHTLLIQPDSGSLFFLGALITTLPLPADSPTPNHCGTCTRCIHACPTGAIVADGKGGWRVDARRCISYLTIETHAPIPEALRSALGNRIYGCDDCQLVCPFNRFTPASGEADFQVRHGLDQVSLLQLLTWSEEDFKTRMAGSPIYRIGYAKWLSNCLIALGNAPKSATIAAAVRPFADSGEFLIADAARWALKHHDSDFCPHRSPTCT